MSLQYCVRCFPNPSFPSPVLYFLFCQTGNHQEPGEYRRAFDILQMVYIQTLLYGLSIANKKWFFRIQ